MGDGNEETCFGLETTAKVGREARYKHHLLGKLKEVSQCK